MDEYVDWMLTVSTTAVTFGICEDPGKGMPSRKTASISTSQCLLVTVVSENPAGEASIDTHGYGSVQTNVI